MRAVLFFSLSVIILSVQAWSTMKRTFNIDPSDYEIHTISECMHVASEPGDYVFKKLPQLDRSRESTILDVDLSKQVCGLYVIGEPDTIVELVMKYYDVSCASGGLMAFVDGWELNGEFFPGLEDHIRPLNERIVEFCNNYNEQTPFANKKFFRSHQNAALLQYRIPSRGSFILNVIFHKISQPCNILVHDMASVYHLSNFGFPRNCTLSALFPSVISLDTIKIAGKNIRQQKVNYECNAEDRLEIGGTSGLDSSKMETSSQVCGQSEQRGPDQAIFCGVSTVRLVSSGKYQNHAVVMLRRAEEDDLELATLICPL